MVNGDGPGSVQRSPAIHRHGVVHRIDPGRVDVAKNAAATVKRVTELGGKSPNIVLDDDAFAERRQWRDRHDAEHRSGCNAPSRMLVPNSRMAEARWQDVAGKVVVDLDNKASIGRWPAGAFDKISA
jgi:aldehyde dehydrogenase (NAD+)